MQDLRHDAVLADADIEVRVTAPGKVELTGSVGNAYLKFHAQELATGAINGVTQLLNRIRHAYVLKQRPDGEIRQDVQEQLFWNRCVNEDMISVDVSGGVVTLTGRVDNRSEADAALSSAWAAEPGDVRNELTVTRDQACDLPPELAGTGRRTAIHPIEANRREASRQPL